MSETIVVCGGCGREHRMAGAVGRSNLCDGCGEALRACRNCEFYEIGAYNDCREPSAERVVDKNAANFCDCFRPAARAASAAGAGAGAGDALSELEKLFGSK